MVDWWTDWLDDWMTDQLVDWFIYFWLVDFSLNDFYGFFFFQMFEVVPPLSLKSAIIQDWKVSRKPYNQVWVKKFEKEFKLSRKKEFEFNNWEGWNRNIKGKTLNKYYGGKAWTPMRKKIYCGLIKVEQSDDKLIKKN